MSYVLVDGEKADEEEGDGSCDGEGNTGVVDVGVEDVASYRGLVMHLC
jgi:hypothetical protein